jgi:chemotaxis protein CheD
MVDLPEVTLHIGQVYATRTPTVVKTVLGSCIAVCLLDPVSRVGGMNHFMLPSPTHESRSGAQFGVHAMDLLIGAMQKAGAERRRLQAKLFGGGHVIQIGLNGSSVPERNIGFIEEFMTTEGITVLSRDLGGYLPRRIQLHTDSGKVYVKRLGQHALRQTRTEEKAVMRILGQEAERFGPILLFDDREVDRRVGSESAVRGGVRWVPGS